MLPEILWRGTSAVCIGELIASAWLLEVLRIFCPWVRRIAYVHGEEITTLDTYDPNLERRRGALRAADIVVVVSRFTAGAVAALLGEPFGNGGRIRLIENGVALDRFRPVPRAGDLEEMYGLEGSFVFLTVCRLLEKKGVDYAIRAFAVVALEHPHSRFLVVGEGPFRPDLEAEAAASGVADKVVFAGSIADSDLTSHYALGDVFVMPNRRLPNGDTEGFGLVFLEANACGLPVIAGRDGGSTDAVHDGQNGLVVDGHSVPAIAAAMLRLRTDPSLRAELRAGGLAAAAAADWRLKTALFLDLAGLPRHQR